MSLDFDPNCLKVLISPDNQLRANADAYVNSFDPQRLVSYLLDPAIGVWTISPDLGTLTIVCNLLLVKITCETKVAQWIQLLESDQVQFCNGSRMTLECVSTFLARAVKKCNLGPTVLNLQWPLETHLVMIELLPSFYTLSQVSGILKTPGIPDSQVFEKSCQWILSQKICTKECLEFVQEFIITRLPGLDDYTVFVDLIEFKNDFVKEFGPQIWSIIPKALDSDLNIPSALEALISYLEQNPNQDFLETYIPSIIEFCEVLAGQVQESSQTILDHSCPGTIALATLGRIGDVMPNIVWKLVNLDLDLKPYVSFCIMSNLLDSSMNLLLESSGEVFLETCDACYTKIYQSGPTLPKIGALRLLAGLFRELADITIDDDDEYFIEQLELFRFKFFKFLNIVQDPELHEPWLMAVTEILETSPSLVQNLPKIIGQLETIYGTGVLKKQVIQVLSALVQYTGKDFCSYSESMIKAFMPELGNPDLTAPILNLMANILATAGTSHDIVGDIVTQLGNFTMHGPEEDVFLILQAWKALCEMTRQEFMPYFVHVMTCAERTLGSSGSSGSSGPEQGGTEVKVNSSQTEYMIDVLQLLPDFIEILGLELLRDYIPRLSQLVFPLVGYVQSDDVCQCAITVAKLLCTTPQDATHLIQVFISMIPKMLEVEDVETLGHLFGAIEHLGDVLTEPLADSSLLPVMVQTFSSLTEPLVERDFIEQDLMLEQSQDRLVDTLLDLSSRVMKTMPGLFNKYLFGILRCFVSDIDSTKTREIAVQLFTSCVEYLEDPEYVKILVKQFWESLFTESFDIAPRALGYCTGILATKRIEFSNSCQEFETLTTFLENSEHSDDVTDNCVSGLARLCSANGMMVPKIVIDFLPIIHDQAELVPVYTILFKDNLVDLEEWNSLDPEEKIEIFQTPLEKNLVEPAFLQEYTSLATRFTS